MGVEVFQPLFGGLHLFLNQILFGSDSDLAWAGVRALTAVCSIIAAFAVRYSRDRFLAWVTLGLGGWVLLKVADDLTHTGGPRLTLYFMVSNLLWSAILIGLARMAMREQQYLRGGA